MKSTSDFTSTFTLICAVSVALAAGMTAIAGQRTSDRPAGDPFEGLAFRSLGREAVKGSAEPVELYAVPWR